MMYERQTKEDLGSTSMDNNPQEAFNTGPSTQPSLESPKMKALNNSFSTKLASDSTNMDYDNLQKDIFGQKNKLDEDYDNLMSVVEKGELDAMKPVSSFKLLVTYVFDFDLEMTESETKNDLCDVSVSGLLGFSKVKEEEAVETVSDDKDMNDDDKGHLCYSDRDVSEPSKKKYPLLKRIFLRVFPLRKYVLKHKNKDHAVE
ncbi:uncharacterized protein LOC127850503 isoform X2 [Dreissena polymorpha]|nr:uncharacterized protein LOC127850503 isoform X2 [Dreissena polymorpha]